MAMRISIDGGRTTFIEKGLKTEILKVEGLDLTIFQEDGNGREAFISHYSDPGVATFLAMLKFLYIHKRDLPEIHEPQGDDYRDFSFRLHAQIDGQRFGEDPFPIAMQYGLYDIPPAILTLNNENPLDPKLEMRASGTLVFSLRTAKKAAYAIPRIYPDMPYFKEAQGHFLEEAAKHPEQLMDLRALRRLQGKQLELDLGAGQERE